MQYNTPDGVTGGIGEGGVSGKGEEKLYSLTE